MPNTLTWGIVALDCKPTVGSLTDYVVTAHWNISGTDGATPPNTGYACNTVSFEVDPSKPNYTPYNELTEAEVIGWVQASLGADQVAAYEASINTQIANSQNPPIVTPPLPWVANTSQTTV